MEQSVLVTKTALQLLQICQLQPESQDYSKSTYAANISKAEAALDWRRPAQELERQVRAFNPFPIAFMRIPDQEAPIRVWAAEVEIGRASCRERAEASVVPASVQVKQSLRDRHTMPGPRHAIPPPHEI